MRKTSLHFVTAALIGLFAAVFFSTAVYSQDRVDSSQLSFTRQAGTLLNSSDVSAANTILTKTLTGVTNRYVHLYTVDVFCSAGTSTLTVDDGVTEIFSIAVSTTQNRVSWATPLTASKSANMVVEVAACGAANTSTLIVQADQY